MEKHLKDYFILKDGKKLAYGYTTGSCATAAAKAAMCILFSKKEVSNVKVVTPFGITLYLDILAIEQTANCVTCAVRKDGGDDPDATHGMLIYAKVERKESQQYKDCEVRIDGGIGIGRVTQKGLDQPVGAAAINHVPREMITAEIQEIAKEYMFCGEIFVTIFAPRGEEVAVKTFNPRLGILGGISILGTTGIVVPMSEEALLQTIRTEMKLHLAKEEDVLLFSPGNYGETFVKNETRYDASKVIQCSNYIGKTIDMAVEEHAKEMLFVAHIGKFIKLAGGIMDTHSKNADCRVELFVAAAVAARVDIFIIEQLLDTKTTEECVEILYKSAKLEVVMPVIMKKIEFYLNNRAKTIPVHAIVFSSVYGFLGATSQVNWEEVKKHE